MMLKSIYWVSFLLVNIIIIQSVCIQSACGQDDNAVGLIGKIIELFRTIMGNQEESGTYERNLKDTTKYLTYALNNYSNSNFDIALVYADLSLKSNENIPNKYKNDYTKFFEKKALLLKGKILISLNNYDEAVASFDAALKIDPEDTEVWTQRSIALYYLGKYDEAIRNLDAAKSLDPQNASIFENMKNRMLQNLNTRSRSVTN
jgi:tetratricopeptide (TPR) repeat protein